MSEGKGAAVICETCSGTGEQQVKHTFEPFSGRKMRPEVTRIYRTSAGIKLHADLVPGGVSYEEWLSDPDSVNQSGNEIREYACPAQWYRSIDASWQQDPQWKECVTRSHCSECPSFPQKQNCWTRWDQEQQNEPK